VSACGVSSRPGTITHRPPVFSAVTPSSRAVFSARDAATPVYASCQAGVYGSARSSYPPGHTPGSPGRATP
jgi:hypothetical protein